MDGVDATFGRLSNEAETKAELAHMSAPRAMQSMPKAGGKRDSLRTKRGRLSEWDSRVKVVAGSKMGWALG
ncbi:MAG: hypothetical protein ACKER6_00065 [Candidatus Hodgkinia cicadicola]